MKGGDNYGEPRKLRYIRWEADMKNLRFNKKVGKIH